MPGAKTVCRILEPLVGGEGAYDDVISILGNK